MATQDWLSHEPEPIREAAQRAVQRKFLCSEPNCCACKHDRELIEKLIVAVRLDAIGKGDILKPGRVA